MRTLKTLLTVSAFMFQLNTAFANEDVARSQQRFGHELAGNYYGVNDDNRLSISESGFIDRNTIDYSANGVRHTIRFDQRLYSAGGNSYDTNGYADVYVVNGWGQTIVCRVNIGLRVAKFGDEIDATYTVPGHLWLDAFNRCLQSNLVSARYTFRKF